MLFQKKIIMLLKSRNLFSLLVEKVVAHLLGLGNVLVGNCSVLEEQLLHDVHHSGVLLVDK